MTSDKTTGILKQILKKAIMEELNVRFPQLQGQSEHLNGPHLEPGDNLACPTSEALVLCPAAYNWMVAHACHRSTWDVQGKVRELSSHSATEEFEASMGDTGCCLQRRKFLKST